MKTDENPQQMTAEDLERAAHQLELDKLEQEQAELAAKAAALRAQKEQLAAKAREPRNPGALALKARDAILNLLAHRSGESDASKPERDVWLALAALLESTAN